MKNSEFQKVYSKIIFEENNFKIFKETNLILEWPEFLDNIPVIGALSKGTTKTLVGLGQSGISLAKGDLKGAAKGIGKTIAAPVEMVADVAKAPIDMVKATTQLISSDDVKNNSKVQEDLNKLATDIPDDKVKEFVQKFPALKDKKPEEVKQIMVMLGVTHTVQTQIQHVQENKPKDEKFGADKEVTEKLKSELKDFKDGKYTITL